MIQLPTVDRVSLSNLQLIQNNGFHCIYKQTESETHSKIALINFASISIHISLHLNSLQFCHVLQSLMGKELSFSGRPFSFLTHILVIGMAWYCTKHPMHYDHFIICCAPHLSYNNS
jgi:hypothetical protein